MPSAPKHSLVKWESKSNRGGHPPNKGHGQRGQGDTKTASPREKTSPHDPPPAPTAPRGSPIAERLAKHALQPWTALTVPQRTVQISPSPPCLLALHGHTAHAMQRGMLPPSFRPHQGKVVSHRRLSLPRAGSTSYWAPRLAAPLSGREFYKVDTPWPPGHLPVLKTQRGLNLSQHAPSQGSRKPRNHRRSPGLSFPSPCTHVHVEETTLGIARLGTCQGKSYSGPIRLTSRVM